MMSDPTPIPAALRRLSASVDAISLTHDEIVALLLQRDAALALLRELEWQWDEWHGAYQCEICGADQRTPHLDDCRLHAVLTMSETTK